MLSTPWLLPYNDSTPEIPMTTILNHQQSNALKEEYQENEKYYSHQSIRGPVPRILWFPQKPSSLNYMLIKLGYVDLGADQMPGTAIPKYIFSKIYTKYK